MSSAAPPPQRPSFAPQLRLTVRRLHSRAIYPRPLHPPGVPRTYPHACPQNSVAHGALLLLTRPLGPLPTPCHPHRDFRAQCELRLLLSFLPAVSLFSPYCPRPACIGRAFATSTTWIAAPWQHHALSYFTTPPSSESRAEDAPRPRAASTPCDPELLVVDRQRPAYLQHLLYFIVLLVLATSVLYFTLLYFIYSSLMSFCSENLCICERK
jgi:hypothetical protein